MTYTYKLLANYTDPITGNSVESTCILRKEDNAYIPKVIGNKDYDEYLEWVAEGNTPDPAD